MKILVVKDDKLLNSTLCYNLIAAGHETVSALSKAEGMKAFEKQDFALAVLDVNLSDGSGFELCQEIKERRPDIVVIFLTANDMESDMLKAFELGADDYVVKPFPVSVFQRKVSALLGRLARQTGADCYDDGTLIISFLEMTSSLEGRPVVFTPMEPAAENPHRGSPDDAYPAGPFGKAVGRGRKLCGRARPHCRHQPGAGED